MAESDKPSPAKTLNINVGILGHVDSGKTSLSRALSTVGSTACFDKHPQSKERGITLDLGFSSFVTELPEQLVGQLDAGAMQITLVDCPGHASLIRTIIGGAQIIDLMILVIDVNKGIQTQTAECLVIGEITNDKMIIVLNKVDMIPEAGRAEKLAKIEARIRKTLGATKFADAPMVAVAAKPGGQEGADGEAEGLAGGGGDAIGLLDLVATLKRMIEVPVRDPDGPLHFAIDHCFPIKGQGTVITGTVLSGSLAIGQEIEFPELKTTRKVKSMQMFKQPVKNISQGDRAGVCVTQLDAKALERGIACTPGYMHFISTAVVNVRQIRFFKAACKTDRKFHFTVGHTTVMGTATFFGPPKLEAEEAKTPEAKAAAAVTLARTPLLLRFDKEKVYEWQEELDVERAEQWAILHLESPVACSLPCAGIGSHLDSEKENSCRLAFHGMMVQSLTQEETESLKIFKRRSKEGQVDRVQDESTVICKNLFNPGTDMNLFLGMKVQLGEAGPIGRIDSTFGKAKFKCVFTDHGLGLEGLQEACKGSKLYLRYKRFVFDSKKKMVQD